MAKPRMLIPAASTRQPGKVDPQTVAMTVILAVPAWQRLLGIPQAAALSALPACTRPRDIVQAAQGARARRHAGGAHRGCICCGTGLGCRPIWTSTAGGTLQTPKHALPKRLLFIKGPSHVFMFMPSLYR